MVTNRVINTMLSLPKCGGREARGSGDSDLLRNFIWERGQVPEKNIPHSFTSLFVKSCFYRL